jgi:hypothetical protein
MLKSVSDEIRGWILEAAKNTGSEVACLPDAEAEGVVNSVFDRYVEGCNRTWWWEGLKLPYTHFDRKAVTLSGILPALAGEVYLIPQDPMHNWPVYRLKAADLEPLLNDCPLFEYGVVSVDGNWFLAESHHDVLFLCNWS